MMYRYHGAVIKVQAHGYGAISTFEARQVWLPVAQEVSWTGRCEKIDFPLTSDLPSEKDRARMPPKRDYTETPTGRAMWQMIGVLAELERSLISERTRAGVKAARGRGVKFGRKPKLTPQQITHALKMIDAGERREDVAALLNVNRTTLYRALAG